MSTAAFPCSTRHGSLALMLLLEDISQLVTPAQWSRSARDEADIISKRLEGILGSLRVERLDDDVPDELGHADTAVIGLSSYLCEEIVFEADT